MAEPHPVYVSLTSFGAAEVRRHGQAWFARLCHAAGADGIEIRGELLQGGAAELAELAEIVADTGMACVYSCPLGLWDDAARFDADALRDALACAQSLGAGTLKMPIGRFAAGDAAGWAALSGVLATSPIPLLVENDQRECSGSQPALQAFFHEADGLGLPLGLTFDVGNWHWVGESSLAMAQVFRDRVRYIHCKGVYRRPDKWVAVPMEGSIVPWRTLLRALPAQAPRAIEHPLVGDDLLAVTRAALDLLRHAY